MNRPSFKNDYSEGATPQILKLLAATNMEGIDGYSLDPYTQKAISLLKEQIGRQDVDIHLIPGGTQCNTIAIAAMLRPHQAVIAADTGHINVHETGAIEATGHKVLTACAPDGKLTPQMILHLVQSHSDEHMVKPGMVYISNTTEVGTRYSLEQLQAIADTCRELGLYLYLDGARLGSALAAKDNDISLGDLANLCDAFYIGATKNGGLFGEAMVLVNPNIKPDFRYYIKQRGALLAKGWLLGLQFVGLFENNEWFSLAAHANEMSYLLAEGIQSLSDKGAKLLFEVQSNQIFISLPQAVAQKLSELYRFEWWGLPEHGYQSLRLVTNWATPKSRVEAFLSDLSRLLG